ncbi:MAG: addiction module protein [Planctomycetota bacterium]
MQAESLPEDIRSLSVADRIALVTAIWDTIAGESPPPLTDEQRREIDHRLAAKQLDGSPGETWRDVRARLLDQR